MRRGLAWTTAFVSLAATAAVPVVGCSVVNSFGSLAPQRDRGAIVVGGVVTTAGGDAYVLTALDPLTGEELPSARRTMTVAGVYYDGTRDLWYVFESGVQSHLFPLPTDPFYVHVMQLDPVTGTWTELAAKAIPPAVSFSTTAVLNERLAYIAYANGRSDEFNLVVLDTSVPAAIHETDEVAIASPPVALVGLRGSSSSETQRVVLCATSAPRPTTGTMTIDAGIPDEMAADEGGGDEASADDGTIEDGGLDEAAADSAPVDGSADETGSASGGEAGADAGSASDGASPEAGATNAAPTNAATLTEYFVSQGPPTAQSQFTVPSIGPLVAFASITQSTSSQPLILVVARPIVSPTGAATVSVYDPVSLSSVAGQFPFGDFNVQPTAFSPCDGYAFVVGTNVETNIHTVDISSLLSGQGDGTVGALTATSQPTGNSGQGLYFEPYTSTVLAPFSQGTSFTLAAFSVDHSSPTGLSQRKPPLWQPPGDLRPNFIATKAPVPFPTTELCKSPPP